MSREEDGRQLPGEVKNSDEPLVTCQIDAAERLETERVLGSFAPRTPRLKRERLLALVKPVKQSAAPSTPAAAVTVQVRTPWYWPAATAVMAATSLALAIVLVVRSSPAEKVEYRDRVVYQTIPLSGRLAATAAGTSHPTVFSQSPRTAQEVERESVSHITDEPPAEPAPLEEDRSLRSLDHTLTKGMDSWPAAPSAPSGGRVFPPATQRELMRQFVPATSLRQLEPSTNWLGWPAGK